MENLTEKAEKESRVLLGDEIDEKYSKIIGVNPETYDWRDTIEGTFIKKFYHPTIVNRISNVFTSSLFILDAYRHGKNFTKKQLVGRLAKVLKIQKLEADKLLPGLLSKSFTWENIFRSSREANFEVHPWRKGKYRLRIEID